MMASIGLVRPNTLDTCATATRAVLSVIFASSSAIYAIARVSKELFHMTDTYVIDVQDPGNALDALMFVLAIDAEKCSRN